MPRSTSARPGLYRPFLTCCGVSDPVPFYPVGRRRWTWIRRPPPPKSSEIPGRLRSRAGDAAPWCASPPFCFLHGAAILRLLRQTFLAVSYLQFGFFRRGVLRPAVPHGGGFCQVGHPARRPGRGDPAEGRLTGLRAPPPDAAGVAVLLLSTSSASSVATRTSGYLSWTIRAG